MKNMLSLLTTSIMLMIVPATGSAGMLLFDVDSDPSGWMASVAGTTASTAYDFNLDPDYKDVTGFFGPLTSAGAGPVSPGVVSPGVTISALALNPVIASDLFAIGPSILGNTANTLYGNQRDNGLTIAFEEPVTALEFNVLAYYSDLADFRFFDAFGSFEEFNDIAVDGSSGHRLGILGTSGTLISRVEIFIPDKSGYDGDGGNEGLTGKALVYRGQPVPTPTTYLLIALGLVMLLQRYRNGPMHYAVKKRVSA